MNDKVGKTIFNAISENVEALSKIFPSAVKDGQVDFDALRAELGTFEEVGTGVGTEKYEFTWNGKAKAKAAANTDISGRTLRYKKGDGVDEDTTQNLYIEGDNLEALKLLRNSYFNRIKMIYIDPPYNTGKDFVYRDNFSMTAEELSALEEAAGDVDEEGNRLVKNSKDASKYHTNWCNMIYPRLKIARDLLTDDGVIFISIDDNEQANLIKICDEVFGSDNFVGILSVENNPKGRKNSDFVSVSSEYCVIYAKSKSDSHFIENIPKKANDMTEDDDGNFVHGSGKRVLVGENSFNKYVTKSDSDKNYSVYYRAKDRGLVIKKEEYGETDYQFSSEGYVKYYSHNDGRLVENTYTESKFRELFEQRALDFSCDKIYEKNFNDTIRIKSQLVNREYEAIVRGNKQNYSMELTTTGAGTYIKNLFEVADSPFSAPKNIGYLKVLISLFENEPFIVLDFFSGSATTADAVLRLNAEDGGNRKFIMVQFPEDLEKNLEKASGDETKTLKAALTFLEDIKKPLFLSEIGKERIRRAGKKIKDDSPITTTDLDIGFKVFKVADTNIRLFKSELHGEELELWASSSDAEARDFTEGYNDLDVVYELLIRHRNVPLSSKIEVVKSVGTRTFIIADTIVVCLEAKLTDTQIKTLAKLDPTPKKFIFRDSAFGDDINLKLNTMTELNALIKANTGDNKSAYKVEFI